LGPLAEPTFAKEARPFMADPIFRLMALAGCVLFFLHLPLLVAIGFTLGVLALMAFIGWFA